MSKGNGSAWVSDVTEFEKPVTLNVSIDDYDENYDYIVIRNHNGEITKLDTTANEGTISFETNRFSTYVFLKKKKVVQVKKVVIQQKAMLMQVWEK